MTQEMHYFVPRFGWGALPGEEYQRRLTAGEFPYDHDYTTMALELPNVEINDNVDVWITVVHHNSVLISGGFDD